MFAYSVYHSSNAPSVPLTYVGRVVRSATFTDGKSASTDAFLDSSYFVSWLI